MTVNDLISALEKWDGDMPVAIQSPVHENEAYSVVSADWTEQDAGPVIMLTSAETWSSAT